MWFVLLIIALVGAGVYTGSNGFYIAAGVVGAWVVFVTLIALAGVRKIKKSVDSHFNDDFFKRF